MIQHDGQTTLQKFSRWGFVHGPVNNQMGANSLFVHMATSFEDWVINNLWKPLITLATKLKILKKYNQKQPRMY